MDLKTKYPILLLHGAGFRDLKWPVYWGRIPNTLTKTGADVFYGQQDCWASVEDNALALKDRLDAILAETGAEKVNIIAHSKGGLDARALATLAGDNIASITTIGTPHHGSKTVDWLLGLPEFLFRIAAFVVNHWIKLIGDKRPDFHAVCKCFSTDYCTQFNRDNPDVPGILYQSYAGVMRGAFSDVNLWITYLIVKAIEGKSDGLVTVDSAKWGESFTILTGNGRRGISHCDEIDLRRMPLSKKDGDGIRDICDVYTGIVAGLKQRGL